MLFGLRSKLTSVLFVRFPFALLVVRLPFLPAVLALPRPLLPAAHRILSRFRVLLFHYLGYAWSGCSVCFCIFLSAFSFNLQN